MAESERMVVELETIGGALEDIRAFCAVIEFGTVSGAARRLQETKGSISRRVSRLERRLGVALLARTPRAVSATEEGAAFYAKAREALSMLEDAAEGARHSQSVPRGHLRVTAPADLGVDVLPGLMVKFRQAHPQITVELIVSDERLGLAANRIDLAFRATLGNLPDMGYRASAVIAFRVALYASPGYLAQQGTPANPQQLMQHDLTVARETVGAIRLVLHDRRGRTEEVPVRAAMRTTDYASAHRIILAGGGIGPMPDLIVTNSLAAGLLIPILSDWHLMEGKVHAISLGGLIAPARVRVFREFIRSELATAVKSLTESPNRR